MELLQLRYFSALAKSEHMTETANRLNVTQSSLSRTIRRLEEDLGVPLFDRIGRALRLNDLGAAYRRRVERALFELEQGRRELGLLASPEGGAVSLAVTTASALPDLLRHFKRERPSAQFHVRMVTHSEMVALLDQGEVDYGLSSSPTNLDGVESRVLLVDPILVVVPRDHPLAARSSARLAELRSELFVGVNPGYGIRDETDAACRSLGFLPNYVYEGDEPARINSLVEAGLGIAFVPATSRRSQDLVRYLTIEAAGLTRELTLSWNRERYLSRTARDFRSIATDYFRTSAKAPAPPDPR